MASDQSLLPKGAVAAATLAAFGGVAAWRRTAPARAIRIAFAAWAQGTGSIYDLMDEGAEIVIPGTTEHSGTYRKDAFLAEVAGPFVARFSAPPLPRLVALWSNGPTVVVQAEAGGTTRDGAGYTNAYVFIFEFAGKRVARVTEFLDMAAFEAVWARVEAVRHDG